MTNDEFRRRWDENDMRTARHTLPALLFCILHSSFCISPASGQWSLTTADLHTEPLILWKIGPEGVRITVPSGGQRVVPMDQFVEVTRPAPATAAPAGKFDLHLVGGDHVTG